MGKSGGMWMAFFRGRYLHSLDAKGRVAIPQRFREALGGGDEALRTIAIFISEVFLVDKTKDF